VPDEVPAYLKEMQITLVAYLVQEAQKEVLTLSQFIKRAKASGMVDKEIENMLFNDLEKGGQIFGDFRKQLKGSMKAGIEQAGRGAIRDEFADVQLWDWLGINDSHICSDCLARHNMPAQSWEKWQAMGLPGSGATICGKNDRCVMVPAGVIEKEKGGLKR